MTVLSPVALLGGDHDVTQFSCGKSELDSWLAEHALVNQGLGATRTYVTCESNVVRGYFSLAPSSIEFKKAPVRIREGLARYPVPVVLLARLAVDEHVQGQHVGESLLLEALQRSHQAAKAIGGVAVLVHALDEDARAFYEQYDSERSPTDPLHLLLLMSDIEATFRT